MKLSLNTIFTFYTSIDWKYLGKRRTRKENTELCVSPLPWGGLTVKTVVYLQGWKGP